MEEDLADRNFLERFTVGIEKVEQCLDGRIDGAAKTPDWAAGICQITSEDIRSRIPWPQKFAAHYLPWRKRVFQIAILAGGRVQSLIDR
ncbi:hypothetical protein IWQ49_002549 [Labrenzia sp. EL_126]|nr:hypothetical protein [Labrenzia sp. EL_126]